jgi:hypothetical protein
MPTSIRNSRALLPGLAAAAFAAWIGAPTAQGDFNIKVVQGQTTGGDTAYILETENTGIHGTGTTLVAWDITATMDNPALGFVVQTDTDIDGDGDGSGLNNDANLTGQANDDTYDYTATAPRFGSTTGTFEGLPNAAETKSTTAYSQALVFINGNNGPNTSQPVWHSYNTTSSTHSVIDPAFTTPNALHSLEMVVADASGGDLDTSFIPIANFVVPTGALFSISGQLGGNSGNSYSMPTTVVNGPTQTITPPPSTLSFGLTNSFPRNSVQIGYAALTSAPQTFTVTGPASITGYLTVAGFTPANAEQIYGLKVNGATSQSQLLSDLQSAANAGAIVETPTGSAASLLNSDGDNIEVVFPTGPSPAGNTADLSYDFSNYTSNGNASVSNVTLVNFNAPPPSSTLSFSLSNTTPAGSNLIASATVTNSPQTFAVSGASSTTGYLSVTGFSPANAEEIYGLKVNGITSQAQLIADVQAAVNADATVETPTGTAGAILTSNGDNVEVLFPAGPDPTGTTAILSYDFSNYTANGSASVSNITFANFNNPPPPVSSTLSLSLTNSVPAGSNLIANATVSQSLQGFIPSGSAETKGYLSVTGSSPANAEEIYGLDANGATSLSQLIADLQAAVNAGATVEAPTGSAFNLLTLAGDNIEVIFPTGPDPAGNTAVFSFDFSNYTDNGTITISHVLLDDTIPSGGSDGVFGGGVSNPEPSSAAIMLVGTFTLLRRRRRKSLPHHN